MFHVYLWFMMVRLMTCGLIVVVQVLLHMMIVAVLLHMFVLRLQ